VEIRGSRGSLKKSHVHVTEEREGKKCDNKEWGRQRNEGTEVKKATKEKPMRGKILRLEEERGRKSELKKE
jgi:hypothetical protein